MEDNTNIGCKASFKNNPMGPTLRSAIPLDANHEKIPPQ